MDILKQKYVKKLKTDIKNEEKWRDEAIELLRQSGIEDIDNNSSIRKLNAKISKLQEEMDNVNDESENFIKFCSKLEKPKPSVKLEENKTFVREDRWSDIKTENALHREFNWIMRIKNSLPSYIKENLKKMPNNKGYLWKGIYFFGHLPGDESLRMKTVFEKHYEKLYIHEINHDSYKIYEKSTKYSNKNLIYVHNN